jgi:outer membrane protein assembly factor BamB
MTPGSRLLRRAALGGAVAVVSAALLAVAGRTDQPGPAPAGDYPEVDRTVPLSMFGGGPGRNLVNPVDWNIPTDWEVTPGRERNVRWVADLGSKAHASPVVTGGKIFVATNNDRPRNPAIAGDRGVLMCLRERDGTFLWQAVHDMLETGRVNDWPGTGIASAPAVEGRRLYYVSNRCELVCADTEGFHDGRNDGVRDEKYRGPLNADVIWRLDMRQGLNVFPHNKANCSPLLVGDLLFVVTGNGVDKDHITLPQPDAPSFLAVHKRTGQVVWKSAAPGRNILHGQWSNPTYATAGGVPQVIFPGGDGWLYAFEPRSGRLLWKFDCNPKAAVYKLGGEGTRDHFLGTPVVWEDRLYVGVGDDPEHRRGVGHLWCIDLVRAVRHGRTNKGHAFRPSGTTSPRMRPSTRAPRWRGTTAGRPRRPPAAITSSGGR